MPFFFWSFGIIGILLFHAGVYLPIFVSALVIALVAWYLIGLYKQSRVGPLTILLFVAYTLPFIHIVPYIWFDFDSQPPLILWGMVVRSYMLDQTTIELMSMLGAVGAAGLAAAVAVLPGKIQWAKANEAAIQRQRFAKTLPMPIFLGWIIIAIALSWISAPSVTLLTSAYTHSESINSGWGFSSAWMISYAFLIFALADSKYEQRQKTANLKRKILLFAILLIAIWFQLLRGDRAVLPCIAALSLMYFVWGERLLSSSRDRMKLPWRTISLLGFVILASGFIIGTMRHSLVGVSSFSEVLDLIRNLNEAGVFRIDNLITGTWSAVLLTPLSVAGDYINGSLSLKYGQTYLDLIASMVPGFVADWIDYERPIDALHGPAWEMTYGIGGTHAVVVPFMNFRMAGVFTIAALLSYGLAKIERYSIKHFNASRFALLGIIAACLPHGLWYGEKYLMNAFVIWIVLSFVYRKQLTLVAANYSGASYRLASYLNR